MSLDAGIAVKVPPPAQTDGEEYYGETLATLPASLTLSASLGASATVDETTTEEPTSAETTEAPADQTTAAETLAGSMGLPEPTEASVEASASASLDPTPLASENMENSTEETPTRTVSRTAAPATCTGLACPGDCNESKVGCLDHASYE